MAQKRFDVKLTHEDPKNRDLMTYTWADDYAGAVLRMEQGMEDAPEVWKGWSFEIIEL